MDKSEPFVERIFREDIDLCLDFPNAELGAKVRQAVLDGIIFVEAVSDKTKLGFPKSVGYLYIFYITLQINMTVMMICFIFQKMRLTGRTQTMPL